MSFYKVVVLNTFNDFFGIEFLQSFYWNRCRWPGHCCCCCIAAVFISFDFARLHEYNCYVPEEIIVDLVVQINWLYSKIMRPLFRSQWRGIAIISLISSFSNLLTSSHLVRIFRLIAPRWPSTASDRANWHQYFCKEIVVFWEFFVVVVHTSSFRTLGYRS